MKQLCNVILFVCLLSFQSTSNAGTDEQINIQVELAYRVQAGDTLGVSVWGEETMQYKDLRVLPDGTISYPLVGVLQVKGRTLTEIASIITDKLKSYIPEPNVNVMVNAAEGNLAYIIGKVEKSGPIALLKDTTVLQALSMSGAFDKFADKSQIKIIRAHDGVQESFKFNYDAVSKGDNLESNIFLKPGDTIIVP